jgi:hypothetical protein
MLRMENKAMEIEPGIYTSLSNDAYHGHHGSYSKSSLADFAVYPYNLIFQRENKKESDAMAIGTAVHTAVLEPHKWNDDVIVIPDSVLTDSGAKGKAFKIWFSKNYDGKRAMITSADRKKVTGMRDSIMEKPEHSKARDLLTGGVPEVSCFWQEIFKGEETDRETGYKSMVNHLYDDPTNCHPVTFKCRPDYYIPAEHNIIVDLKTTKYPISRGEFEKHAYNLKYHWSAGMTLRGMRIASGKNHNIYIFVVVEVEPPHEVAVFRASNEFIALGKKEVLNTMGRLAYWDKHNFWPGAPNLIQMVGLPGWAMKKLND